jgi:hypothetical protein
VARTEHQHSIRVFEVFPGAIYLRLARTIYIRCIYGVFGREITKYTVIYGVYIRFWPTLHILDTHYGFYRLSTRSYINFAL